MSEEQPPNHTTWREAQWQGLTFSLAVEEYGTIRPDHGEQMPEQPVRPDEEPT